MRPHKMLLGIDFGEKNIGVSVSDETGVFAFPKGVIVNDGKAISKLASLISEHKINIVVFGLSKNSQGVENTIMKSARKFAEELEKISGVKIFFQDETFSSMHAELGGNKNLDASAAAIILQRYIDANQGNTLSRRDIPRS